MGKLRDHLEVSGNVGTALVQHWDSAGAFTDILSGWLHLGALVVVLSIAADPLNQQLIQYKQRVVYSPDTSTTIDRAVRYSRGAETFVALAQVHLPGKLQVEEDLL